MTSRLGLRSIVAGMPGVNCGRGVDVGVGVKVAVGTGVLVAGTLVAVGIAVAVGVDASVVAVAVAAGVVLVAVADEALEVAVGDGVAVASSPPPHAAKAAMALIAIPSRSILGCNIPVRGRIYRYPFSVGRAASR